MSICMTNKGTLLEHSKLLQSVTCSVMLQTVFPDIEAPAGQTREQYSECAMQGLAVKPRKGDASLFWSLKTTGEFNQGARHGSCPVIKGEKCVRCACSVLHCML